MLSQQRWGREHACARGQCCCPCGYYTEGTQWREAAKAAVGKWMGGEEIKWGHITTSFEIPTKNFRVYSEDTGESQRFLNRRTMIRP